MLPRAEATVLEPWRRVCRKWATQPSLSPDDSDGSSGDIYEPSG